MPRLSFQGIPSSSSEAIVRQNASSSSLKKIQRGWSCPLCLVSTTSENCLKMHFQGKKHVLKVVENGSPSSQKKVQLEWSCPLCLVSTTSENCLKMHFQGKKHVLKEKALQGVKEGPVSGDKSSEKLKRTNAKFLLCRWKKPQIGWTKLNTDGSIEQGNGGVAGGLLRDHKGEPICAFVDEFPADDIFLVELRAILEGLVIASSLRIKALWVESDSLSVVNTINRDQRCCLKASSSVRGIWGLLEKFDKYFVSHTFRESNRAADHLAKKIRCKIDEVVLYPGQFPDSLNKIIKEDAEGRYSIRCLIPCSYIKLPRITRDEFRRLKKEAEIEEKTMDQCLFLR